MAVHFESSEYAARQAQALANMAAEGLDGLLLFRQESMYYLTGYDSFGFCFFQCLVLSADGRLTLLTRAPDLRQAQNTSILGDIRIWTDDAAAEPQQMLKDILADQNFAGKRIGVEYDAYGLTAASGKKLDAVLHGFCHLTDASFLVSQQRLIKSPAELAYVRRAGALADDAWQVALDLTASGVNEGEILAGMQGAVFRGGGDYAGNEFIIGSGNDALLCRYFSGRRQLDRQDQLTLEFAGAYRHYHACMMRTIVIGAADDHQRHMFLACTNALDAAKAALRPGRPIGEVFDAHAAVMDAAGLNHARLNACGYSLGAVFAPIWMDYPMFYHGNPVIAAPGMVFFLHMILMDSQKNQAMTLGETVLVTDGPPERLSAAPIEMVVR